MVNMCSVQSYCSTGGDDNDGSGPAMAASQRELEPIRKAYTHYAWQKGRLTTRLLPYLRR